MWVFILLERLLIPFGLHHILYSPFYYDNAVVPGGLYAYWATKLPELAASTASLKSLVPEAGDVYKRQERDAKERLESYQNLAKD